MATYTTNYNLIKPADADGYDIAHQNGNMDIIDSALKTIDGKAKTHVSSGIFDTKLPSEYSVGISVNECSVNFPSGSSGSGTVVTHKISDIRCTQIGMDYLGDMWTRGAVDGGTWSAWKRIARNDKIENDVILKTGFPIAADVNIDRAMYAGKFLQHFVPNGASNWPYQTDAMMFTTLFGSDYGAQVAFGNGGFYYRSLSGGTWGTWRTVQLT